MIGQFSHYRLLQCVIPENIHTSPTEGIFFLRPPTPLEIPIKLHTFLSIFWPYRTPPHPPPPRKFQSLLWGEYGYFLELHNDIKTTQVFCFIQVLGLLLCPDFLDDPSFPQDAKNRAKQILNGIPGHTISKVSPRISFSTVSSTYCTLASFTSY